MKVSPVALNSCGACNYTPRSTVLRPNESSVLDKTDAVSINKANLVTYLSNIMYNLNQRACVAGDRTTRCAEFVNLWLQSPNQIIRELALIIVHPEDSDDLKMEKLERWVANRRKFDHRWMAGELPYDPDLIPMKAQIGLKNDTLYVADNSVITHPTTAITNHSNRVRNPEGYGSDGREIPIIFSPNGSLFNRYI